MCRQLSSQEGVLFSECRWRSVYVRLRIPDSKSAADVADEDRQEVFVVQAAVPPQEPENYCGQTQCVPMQG